MKDDEPLETNMVDWNTLIDEHGPLVLRISWRILGNRADAEDNAQDVFLKAYRLQRREKVQHWKGLLRRMASLGALERIRRRRNQTSLEDLTPVDPGEGPQDLAMRSELQNNLRIALADLPPREGAVFTLHFFEEMSLQEIADSLEVSYAAAGAALSRARAKLEQALRGAVQGEPS